MKTYFDLPETNKAVRLDAIGDFKIVEMPIPKLKDDEILVRVAACGICGSDIPRIYELGTRVYPVVLGHEFSGEVVAVSNESDEDLLGRKAAVFPLIPCRVCPMCKTGNYAQCNNYNYLGSRSDGGFAEYCIIPSRWHLVLTKGDDVSMEDLCLVEPATVGQHALRKAGLRNGDKVLIVGAGPIGILTARWASLFGASRVVLFDVLDEKIKFAYDRGFEIYNSIDLDLDKFVLEQTNGQGFDVVIEGTGTSGGLMSAINCVRTFGSIGLLGNPHKDTVIALGDHSNILRKEIRLTGMWNSVYDTFPFNEWHHTVDMIENGKLKVDDLITHRAGLDDLEELTNKIWKNKVVICKAIYSAQLN